jgi:hypothetical protein
MTDRGNEPPNTPSNDRIERMEVALRLIAKTSCERMTSGPGSCWSEPTWSPDARFGADRWCYPCTALAALLPVGAAVETCKPRQTDLSSQSSGQVSGTAALITFENRDVPTEAGTEPSISPEDG